MILITAQCYNGHKQELRIHDELGIDFARTHAELLDGTSPMYVFPPGADSMIGKCGICKVPFRCTIEEGVADDRNF